MQIRFDKKYERSKKKLTKNIGLENIIKTEDLFKSDCNAIKLEIKAIVCKRDKNKKSIRVLGNQGYRILITIKDDIYYFQDIMNHDKYDRLTKNC